MSIEQHSSIRSRQGLRGRVLIVDDDPDLLASAADWLEISGFVTQTVSDPLKVTGKLKGDDVDVVLSDIRMPGLDGMALLAALRRAAPELPVVLMTGHGDVPLAVKAMQGGAEDFIEKPWDADHLVSVLDRAVEKRRLTREISRLSTLVQGGEASSSILGDSQPMRLLRERVATLAAIDIDVLVIGETGTGKELVARALHDGGPRAKGPFVAINCAAIPESVFESEVFGHARGAFTGAQGERTGKLEFAHGGTVFLDEIESMPLALQAKILRALQERMIERLGDNRSRPLDIRVVAAAKSDLSGEIAAGRFRQDLFFRLAGSDIRIPPLRTRGHDAALLYRHFAVAAAKRHGRPVPAVNEAFLGDLTRRDWPGNVRELKAFAERHVLGLERPVSFVEPSNAETLPERLQAFEMAEIRKALKAEDWRVQAAAVRLGIPRRTLAEKIARFGLSKAETDRDWTS